LVEWCQKNLSFASFAQNPLQGKLEYSDRSFDFIYAWSVFTHLTEHQGIFWIDELRRVLRPGGYLYFTTHGRVAVKDRPGMWRSVKSSGLSDMANLSWSKDAVLAQAAREVIWDAANAPPKCPVKRGPRDEKSSPMRLNAAGLNRVPS
jgi:SAM-dependent methyltransferase